MYLLVTNSYQPSVTSKDPPLDALCELTLIRVDHQSSETQEIKEETDEEHREEMMCSTANVLYACSSYRLDILVQFYHYNMISYEMINGTTVDAFGKLT